MNGGIGFIRRPGPWMRQAPWENRRMDQPIPGTHAGHGHGKAWLTPRDFALGAAFVAAYVGADWVSYLHPMQQSGITPWNPQPAFAIALLMRAGQRTLPLVFLAALLAEWLVRDAMGGWPSALLV